MATVHAGGLYVWRGWIVATFCILVVAGLLAGIASEEGFEDTTVHHGMVGIRVSRTTASHGFGVLLVVAFAALLDGVDIGVILPTMRGSSPELITPIATPVMIVISAIIIITPFIAAVRAPIVAPIVASVVKMIGVMI
jgi:hypothetical protein